VPGRWPKRGAEQRDGEVAACPAQPPGRGRRQGFGSPVTFLVSHRILPPEKVRRIALLSDGATRFVEFGLGTFANVLDILESQTPARLFGHVREAEASDPAGERSPRAKKTDDIAAIYLPT
jgi:hypothetical protein